MTDSTGKSSGILYIVSTPIGNLDDISIRGVQTLSKVDLIAAEDTRTTGILLHHYNIHKPMVSYHSYNEAQRTPELIERMLNGASVALVSDAGTPGISDPAYKLITETIKNNIRVSAMPGATAFLPALIVSGFPMKQFVFEGFLPLKKGRQTLLEELKQKKTTIILYESPHKLLRTLTDLEKVFGNRNICVARELTKKFEEIVRGRIREVLERFTKVKVRGEFVIVIAPPG